MDKDHLSTPTEGRTYIDSNNTSLGKLLEMLHGSRRNAEEIMRLAEEKLIDSACAFASSKVRAIMSCDFCNAPRCIYSKKSAGEPNSPGKLQACILDQWTESGYACGNEVSVEGFYA